MKDKGRPKAGQRQTKTVQMQTKGRTEADPRQDRGRPKAKQRQA